MERDDREHAAGGESVYHAAEHDLQSVELSVDRYPYRLKRTLRRMMAADLAYYGNNGLALVRDGFEQQRLLGYILEDRKRLMQVGDEER